MSIRSGLLTVTLSVASILIGGQSCAADEAAIAQDKPGAGSTAAKTIPPRPDPRTGMKLPDLPEKYKNRGERGRVIMDVFVLEDGNIGDVKVAESSGYPQLDAFAVEHVKTSWHLLPGKVDGKATAMWAKFAMSFN